MTHKCTHPGIWVCWHSSDLKPRRLQSVLLLVTMWANWPKKRVTASTASWQHIQTEEKGLRKLTTFKMIQAQARSSSFPSTHTGLAGAVKWAQVLVEGMHCSAFFPQFFLLKACSEVGLNKIDTRGGSKRVNDVVSTETQRESWNIMQHQSMKNCVMIWQRGREERDRRKRGATREDRQEKRGLGVCHAGAVGG